jgi:hypothetical protein
MKSSAKSKKCEKPEYSRQQRSELKFWNSSLDKEIDRIRRKLGADGFSALLYYMEGDYPTQTVVRIGARLGVKLRPWQIVMWRKVMTMPSRKLVPDLAAYNPTPLYIVK